MIFTPTFFKSLNKIAMHNTWWYALYEMFRYNIPNFFKNVWLFRKQLYNFYAFDYTYNLQLFKRSLELTLNVIKDGNESDIIRNKKIEKIKRAIELLSNFIDDNFLEQAEKELNLEYIVKDWEFVIEGEGFRLVDNENSEERIQNKRISDRSFELHKSQWKELWQIFEGQDISTLKNYEEEFDGSGINGWWS